MRWLAFPWTELQSLATHKCKATPLGFIQTRCWQGTSLSPVADLKGSAQPEAVGFLSPSLVCPSS